MLPTKLEELKSNLESKRHLSNDEIYLLKELRFINSNTSIQEEIKKKYQKSSLFESFAGPRRYCPTCGKKL